MLNESVRFRGAANGLFSLGYLMVEIRDKIDLKQFAVSGESTTQALVYLLHIILAALDDGHRLLCSIVLC